MIFIDTNFLISFFIEEETEHERAQEVMEQIKDEEKIISKLIIAETINLLNNKLKIDKKRIEIIYEELKKNYTIIEDTHVFDKAVQKTIKEEKRIPFFDLVFIILMKELEITRIATFDKHFQKIKGIKTIH